MRSRCWLPLSLVIPFRIDKVTIMKPEKFTLSENIDDPDKNPKYVRHNYSPQFLMAFWPDGEIELIKIPPIVDDKEYEQPVVEGRKFFEKKKRHRSGSRDL